MKWVKVSVTNTHCDTQDDGWDVVQLVCPICIDGWQTTHCVTYIPKPYTWVVNTHGVNYVCYLSCGCKTCTVSTLTPFNLRFRWRYSKSNSNKQSVERKTVMTSYFSTTFSLRKQNSTVSQFQSSNSRSFGHSCCALAPRYAPVPQVSIHITLTISFIMIVDRSSCIIAKFIRTVNVCSKYAWWIGLRVTWSNCTQQSPRISKCNRIHRDYKIGAREK